jgi:hypothetical protein
MNKNPVKTTVTANGIIGWYMILTTNIYLIAQNYNEVLFMIWVVASHRINISFYSLPNNMSVLIGKEADMLLKKPFWLISINR